MNFLCEVAPDGNVPYSICSVRGCYEKPVGRFKGDAIYCNVHYQRMRRTGCTEIKPRYGLNFDTCAADGCDKKSRSKHGKWCEVHYSRLRRNGTLNPKIKKRAHTGIDDNGYVWVLDPIHPLSNSGRVRLHRKVLFDAIGPGSHACRWCGVELTWGGKGHGSIIVDHLNGDKENNDLSNLVVACHTCNSTRGLFMKWAIFHQDDPFIQQMALGLALPQFR